MQISTFSFCLSLLGLCSVVQAACGSNDPWTVQLPSSTIRIPASFTAQITGVTNDESSSIAITGNAGIITQKNRTTAVTVGYEIPFGGDLVLYSFLGTNSNGILMGWAYCTGKELTSLWLEGTDGTEGFTNSSVSGSCDITKTPTSVELVTNGGCLSVVPPAKVPTIDGGNEIFLKNGSVGSAILDGKAFNLIPFAIIDCADCESNSAGGGWMEVHSVLTGKTSADICVGIFYMFLKCDKVEVHYVQCFVGSATSYSFDAGYDLSGSFDDSSVESNANVTACTLSASTSSSARNPSTTSSMPSGTGTQRSPAAGPLTFSIAFLILLSTSVAAF